jgi:hypothetical protein
VPASEIVEHIHFAAKAARLHGQIDFIAHVESLVEQHSGTGDGQAAVFRGSHAVHRPALARFEHFVGGFEHQQNVAARHPENHHKHHRHAENPQGLQDVRPRSGVRQYQHQGSGRLGAH